MKVYSIFDSVACEYGPIFEAKNDEVASRAYNHLLKDVEVKTDYILTYVGDFVVEGISAKLVPANVVGVPTVEVKNESGI